MRNAVIVLCWGLLGCLQIATAQKSDRNYFKKEFHPNKITRIEPKFIHFDDLIPSDTLYACYTTNKFPHAYFREVFTNVCNGGECLPVWLFIYWSAGGSYLGYSLKGDNILTKERHVPFTEEDYEQFHSLLDNPQSLLKNYEIKEIEKDEGDTAGVSEAIAKRIKEYGNYSGQTQILRGDLLNKWSAISMDSATIDGVTGATDKEVKLFVVKGALYTTHTLWHIIYGATRDSIRANSINYVSPQFLDTLLYSTNADDKQYALSILNRFDTKTIVSILPKLEEFVLFDNFLLKENTINVLRSPEIPSELSQKTLSNVFRQSDIGTKQMILEKLAAYPNLSTEIISTLVANLARENTLLIQNTLKLLDKQASVDVSAKLKVADLLGNNNAFIAKLAYKFLSTLKDNEPTIEEKIRAYTTKLNSK